MQTKPVCDVLSKRKPKNSTKNLSVTFLVKIDPLENNVEHTNNKNPPSLAYPMYLSPSNSGYQQTSRSLVLSGFPDPAIQLDCNHY